MKRVTKCLRLRVLWRLALGAAVLLLCVGFAFRLALPLVPLPPALFQPPHPSVEFVDRHGQPLREVRNGDEAFAKRVSLAEIPQPLVQATLAAEDKRFWQHPGVDVRALVRAAWSCARRGRVVSGGSTVTMQLIKLSEPRPRTLRTKLIEAAQALRLEQIWSKQRIVAEYLNRIDYGNFNVGCAEAAEFYFGKPLRDLRVAEGALLAGLPQAPSRLNPHRHFDRACRRQQWVLRQMRENGWLTEEELARSTAEPLRLARPRRVFQAPHFVDLVLSQEYGLECWEGESETGGTPGAGSRIQPELRKGMGSAPAAGAVFRALAENSGAVELLPAPPSFRQATGLDARARPATPGAGVLPSFGVQVQTTLDLDLNRFAERTLRSHLARLAAHHAENGAVVVLDNRSGDVLALVGSEDYFAPQSGQVNGAWAGRSAGSTFKPFTYLLAFERGANPATVVADVPTEFATATGLFTPVNYDRRCHGPMPCRLALANSLNIPAVKVLASLGGPEALQQRLQSCGLTTLTNRAEHYGLGLTLGNAETRLLELANAYACLARLGEFKPFRLVQSSRFKVQSSTLEAARVGDAGAAWLITDILSDNAARAMAFGTESSLRFDFPVACKTGTSSDFRDNWAFGYTPEFTVGVWVGNFDGSPMERVSGVSGAAPVLHDLFEHLHARFGTTWYERPANIVERPVNPLTGRLIARDTSGTAHKATPRSGVSVERRHSLAMETAALCCDTAMPRFIVPTPCLQTVEAPQALNSVIEKFLAHALPGTESPDDYDSAGRVRLAAEYRDWLASGANWLGTAAVAVEPAPTLRIVSPLPGTVFYLDPDLPDSGRRIRLRAEGRGELRWESDSVDCRVELGAAVARLSKGRHRLVVQEPATGARRETWIEVKQL
ncbi:MAG: transglycosylase domain-containing protein [Verrucomicrobia bacterium]|nr:transglycosylase domain-containing protein [Verrucomicrobiota bacterium]